MAPLQQWSKQSSKRNKGSELERDYFSGNINNWNVCRLNIFKFYTSNRKKTKKKKKIISLHHFKQKNLNKKKQNMPTMLGYKYRTESLQYGPSCVFSVTFFFAWMKFRTVQTPDTAVINFSSRCNVCVYVGTSLLCTDRKLL